MNLLSTLTMITQLMNNSDDVDICFLAFSYDFDIINNIIICAELDTL